MGNVNEAPTAINIVSGLTVAENAAGAVVGEVAVIDPDAGDTFLLTVDNARLRVRRQRAAP